MDCKKASDCGLSLKTSHCPVLAPHSREALHSPSLALRHPYHGALGSSSKIGAAWTQALDAETVDVISEKDVE